MAFITGELTLDETEDWFKIGHEASQKQDPKLKLLAASSLGGRVFDPRTGGVFERDHQKERDSKLPKYRRSHFQQNRHQYVEEYKRQEHEELLSQASINSRDTLDAVSSKLEGLEVDSVVLGGSVAVPEDLIPENATDVYRNYEFNHSYVELPILEARETIVSTIESNQVTIIQGPTGSGKTTQVPQFILDHYADESRYCNIVVTQPRKIAAISIAQRVCDERGWSLGSMCGYQLGMARMTSEDTRILYCTTGVLKEKLINRKNMHEYTHIILDEVHERDIESDFALLIVKKLLRTNSPHVKVILMSATFDTQVFAQYFQLPVGDHLELAPVITVGTGHYHVSEFFADDLTSRLGEVPPVDEMQPGIQGAMYDMAIGLMKEFDLLEQKEQGVDSRTGFAPVRGTVLIFVPGLIEIINMCDRIKPLEDTHFLFPIPLHSTITIEEQGKVFKKPARGFRKVIVSTNIAESSITVPDIKYVIDFCLTKNLCCDPDTNYPQLQLEWASKANAKQRKGRAGRVSNGRVYYMVPRWFFERVLPDYGTPEMQRSPLDSLVLKTKVFNMGEPKALLGLALSPPNLLDIGRTILNLKEVGALSSTVGEEANPYDGALTFIGHVLANLPVDIRIGKLLVLGHVFGVLEECLIIGSALSVKSIFANPMQARLDAYKAKLSWSDNSLSDCIAMLNAYKTWENRMKMKEFERAGATEKQWGMKRYIQIRRMKEVHEMATELEERLKGFNIVRPRRPPKFKNSYTSPTERLILKLVLCAAFYPNYAIKEETDEVEAVRTLSNNDPRRTVLVKGLPMNQGILYEKQIKDIFSCCCKDPPPRISCEQSRAYVEFQWKSGAVSEGKIHPAVNIALKIRHLGIKMSFEMFDKDETNRRMKELQKATSYQRAERELRTDRLKAEGGDQVLKSGIGDVNINPQISTLLINVSEVVECGHFWAQPDDAETGNQLVHIQAMLNDPSKPLQLISHSLRPGTLVAAPYQDAAEHFYRARIEEVSDHRIPGGGNLKKVVVFFVDYGNTEEIHVDRLRALPPECQTQPFVALEFFLTGIRPSNYRCAEGKWSQQANSLFRSWTLNKTLFAQVYSVVNNAVRVELVSKFRNGQEICYNEELVNQGFADKAEESFLSQQNHEWRELQKQGEGSTVRPDSWVQVNVPTESGDARQGGGKRRGKKVYLSGPVNPLEMSFSSVTLSGRQRVVKVDPESVNSAAVDDDPQNKFSRLLVASFMGLNPAGNSMIARDTTIMPQIPGLPALVTLLFAPYAEYRTDPKREFYIGAVCGLGYDDENCPILPDHDIELAFETKFETEDIAMINDVRMAINIAVGTEDMMAGWGEDMFISIQEKVREKLLALLKKQRDPVVPRLFNKPYEWNQVEPENILHHNLSDTEADAPHLLRLHNAICLVEEDDDPTRGPKTQYYLSHLEHLRKIVSSHQRHPIECKLCRVTLATSQILAIHMQTERHLRNEERVHQGKYQ